MIKLKIKYGNSQTDIRFPCTEKALQEALAEIGAEQVRPLELYVTEVVFPEELAFLQDRFVNLDEVNFLVKRMDSFFGDEEYQFYEAMKLEGFDTLPDLINLSFNLNRYPLIRDIGDMGKIGREYLLTVNGCVPADDADDPKYAELGRELIQSGNGIFTEHGMLFVDENTPFQLSYDGQTFPPYLYDPGVLCVAVGGSAVACPLERRTPLPHHRQGQRVLSAGGRGHAPGRGCPVSRRGHRREDAGVYDRYGSRPAAQSQRTGWRLPHPR